MRYGTKCDNQHRDYFSLKFSWFPEFYSQIFVLVSLSLFFHDDNLVSWYGDVNDETAFSYFAHAYNTRPSMFNKLASLDKKIPQDFACLVSSTELRTCSYLSLLHSRRNFLHTRFFTLSCLFKSWFFSILRQALIMCVTLSTLPLQSLQSRVSLVMLMSCFTELVLIACSCAAQKDFQSPFSALLSSTTYRDVVRGRQKGVKTAFQLLAKCRVFIAALSIIKWKV